LVAAAGNADKIKLWDPATGRALAPLTMKFTDFVSSIAFSPDGQLVAIGDGIGVHYVWDVASRRLLRTIDEDTGLDTSLAFSPDGKLLARASKNAIINLWDVPTWRLVRVMPQKGP
jgi:WD40 repeat protein